MKKIFLFCSAAAILYSCGGGGSGIYGSFGTVLVGITSLTPTKVNSDTLIWVGEAGQLCSISFQDDAINIKIKSETIKDAAGKPVTSNPSPVYFDSYRVIWTSAVSNNTCEGAPECRQIFATPFAQLIGITVPPDSEVAVDGLVVALASWKSSVLSQYCVSSLDNCIYNAVLELHGREVLTGREKVIRASFNIQFADYNKGNACGAEDCVEDSQVCIRR
ncbi:MAG: hypothetical protein ACK4SM_01210 [Aquificaceae bacterium]